MLSNRRMASKPRHSCELDHHSAAKGDCRCVNSMGEAQKCCAGRVQTQKSTIPFTEILELAKEPLILEIRAEIASGVGNGLGRDT